MNDVTMFIGIAAFLMLALMWMRNGRVTAGLKKAADLAVGPIAPKGSSSTNLGFSDDDATWLGDDMTLAPVSNVMLTVVKSKTAKGPKSGARYALADGVNAVGRMPTSEPLVNLIAIEQDRAISQNHLYIEMNGEHRLTATDRGSRYGTKLNGRRLEPQEATPIKSGDALTLGNTTFKIEREGDETLDSLIRIASQYRFEVISGPAQGQNLVMNQDSFVIGRNQQSDWQLPDRKVSRTHAQVQREGDLIRIVNRSRNNSMQINGRDYQSRVLEVGDVIKLGDSEIKFERS